MMPNSSVVKGY